MTNETALEAGQKYYRALPESVRTGEGRYIDCFKAGADWQREQLLQPGPVRLVPRMPEAPPPACQNNREHWRQQVGKLESGARSLQDRIRARDEKIAAQNDVISSHVERRADLLRENAVLQGEIDNLNKRIETQAESIRYLHSERDDWHCAYDKLVSDLVHGRKRVFNVKVSAEDEAEINKAADDMSSFGTGCVHVDQDGKAAHVDLSKMFVRKVERDVREFVPEDASGLKAMWDDIPVEVTGGFTATGEAGADPAKPEADPLDEDDGFKKALHEALAASWDSGCRFGRRFP